MSYHDPQGRTQPCFAPPPSLVAPERKGASMSGEALAIEQFDAIDLTLREILRDVLGLTPERTDEFTVETGLFGHLPELDSMAVAGLLTGIEDKFDIVIEDDEVDGEMLETYGALLAFVTAKLSGE
jgi:acyl carrier protein